MDFSKIKKILIILCIVSVLLNIFSKFSKVFAFDIVDNGNDVTLPDFDTLTQQYINAVGTDDICITICRDSYYSLIYSLPYTNSNGQKYPCVTYNRYNSSTGQYDLPSQINGYYVHYYLLRNNEWTSWGGIHPNMTFGVSCNANGVLYSNSPVYKQGSDDVAYEPEPTITFPELLNNSLTLENLSFQSYNISAGDYEDITFYALFYDRSVLTQDDFWDYPQVVLELSPDNKYWLEGDTTQKYKIPITDVPLTYKPDTTYSIAFAVKQFSSSGGGFRGDDWTWEFLGNPRSWTTLSPSAINTDLDNLNNETDKQNLINYQNNVTNNLSNIYGSLTGTDTTDNDNSLAQSGVITENNQDITASGFDNIFNMFYNGITATPVDIVLPIPFTQQTITIQPDYIRNALGTNNIILNLIESFWYFAVSLYIVKDIENLIRKMKNGDVATSSDTNIKADML